MAQRVGEPSLSVALEETPLSTPLSFAVTSAVPTFQTFQSQLLGNFFPLISGHRPSFAGPEPTTEAVSMTTARTLGFQFPAPVAQGSNILGTHSDESSSAVGSLPIGQSVSQPPVVSDSSPILHFSLPTDGTPDEQYQCMMKMAQALQGMALSVRPSVFPVAPEIQQPFSVFQAHPTSPPP